jgi:tetratricopeptide (TPR) repeat protein
MALVGLLVVGQGSARQPGKAEVEALYRRADGLRKAGKTQEATKVYEQAVEKAGSAFGKDHVNTALLMNNLAALYDDLGQYAKAEPLYRRSLEIREAKLGRDHPSVATSLNNLARLYHALEEHGKAAPLYQRSLEIYEAKLGKDHPLVATALNNLALLCRDMGQHARAESLFRRCLEIAETKLGKNHPHAAHSLNGLALLHAATGKPKEAARLVDRARRGTRQHLATVLPALSDRDKAAFFQNTSTRADLLRALSLGLSEKDDAELARQSAMWLLNGKAVDQESLASSLLLARQSNDPEVGKLSRQLLAVRQDLARLTLVPPRPGQDRQHLQQIEQLGGQEQELSKRLRQAGSKAAAPAWVELSELRQALPSDGVFIDVAHFDVYHFRAARGKEWQAARYAAWVTPKKGAVRLIDLGPADRIDAAIRQFREAIQRAGKRIADQGEEKADKALR